jgi:hypothetical protein
MSEKIVDPHSFLGLYKSDIGRSRAERGLLERRLTDEADKQAIEDAATFDRPSVPDAQLVFDPVSQTMGVAVRHAKFVCRLPKGYGGPGCELAMLEGNKFVVVQPDKATLLINPETGSTRPL